MTDHDELFQRYLDEIARYPALSPEEELDLGRKIKAGDDAASHTLVQSNLRLVVAIARKYTASNIPLLDLVQEGNLGLLHAANKYDPERGFRFSTYATWWIRQSITRAITQTGGVTDAILAEGAEHARMQDVWDHFVAHHNRQPTLTELAADLGWSEERVSQLLRPPEL